MRCFILLKGRHKHTHRTVLNTAIRNTDIRAVVLKRNPGEEVLVPGETKARMRMSWGMVKSYRLHCR